MKRRGRPPTKNLPTAIVSLREARAKLFGKFKSIDYMTEAEYSVLQEVMNSCSMEGETDIIKCDTCPYKDECDSLVDYLGGKVVGRHLGGEDD